MTKFIKRGNLTFYYFGGMYRRLMKWEDIKKMMCDSYYGSNGFKDENGKPVGILALMDVQNFGFCKDGVTRWYTFSDNLGNPAIYFKY